MKNRLAYIDGLRAIAVLSVAFYHGRTHAAGAALEPWARECKHGVELFFVLSGFCLSYPTLERLAASGSARFDCIAYALKRFLRIIPPYLVALSLFGIAAAWLTAANVVPPESLNSLGVTGVLQNLLFLDKPHEYVNNSFWTLGIEFRWYFLFPFALGIAARSARALVASIVLVAIASELTAAASIDLGCLTAFLLGLLAAHARIHGARFERYLLPLGIGAVCFALLNETRPHFPQQTNVGWHAVAFCIVAAGGAWRRFRAVLGHPILVRIGTASYSIYLVHEPIGSAVATRLAPYVGSWAATALAIGSGVAAGFVFWAIVERPLTDPGFVRRFVERGRHHMIELFAVADAPGFLDLSIRSKLAAYASPQAVEPALAHTAV